MCLRVIPLKSLTIRGLTLVQTHLHSVQMQAVIHTNWHYTLKGKQDHFHFQYKGSLDL